MLRGTHSGLFFSVRFLIAVFNSFDAPDGSNGGPWCPRSEGKEVMWEPEVASSAEKRTKGVVGMCGRSNA